MPNLDKTGPIGQGPKTGRGLGPCEGGVAYAGRGGGFGRGLGRGRFLGCCPAPVPTKQEEKEFLVAEASALEEELKAVKARLAKIKGQK